MITLASDFGSPYPAAMRGVLLQHSDARLVDVAHDFPRQDVRAAAFWLREVLPYFPPATHLVVVDPGVGTDRDALVVRAGDHVLVGPDNGVLVPVARRLAGDAGFDAFVVTDPDSLRPGTTANEPAPDGSTTFHGRDLFAPAAARVHDHDGDLAALEWLAPADGVVDLTFPEPRVAGDEVTATVLVVDDFGNAVTNVPGGALGDADAVTVDGERVPVGETFAAVPEGDRVVTVGSHGNVELDVNHGRGDAAFGVEPGDEVTVSVADGAD